jgi:transcriptional regulator with XRE-family HTH domain
MSEQIDYGATTLRYFGGQMKPFRNRAGLSRAELGDRTGYSEATVASIEQGRRMPQQEFVEKTDRILGADGLLRAGLPYLLQSRYPTWFRDFALLEADAVSLYSYENHAMPGLLQTEEHVRAVISARCPPLNGEEIENRIAARVDRQKLLEREPCCVLGFVIEEVVLRRPIGGREVHRRQLRRLLECAEMRNVSVQIMPTRRETHMGLDGPFALLETPDGRNMAYSEGQSGSFLVSDRKRVSVLAQRYGIIRAQALPPEESAHLIEQAAGET